MGVYIKDMEMPKVAGRMEAVITILKDGTAQIAISPADDGIGYWKEYSLISVPRHGRLIDADALMDKAYQPGAYGYVDAIQIENAPTIIPEEEGEA